jgi:hypothetical protein
MELNGKVAEGDFLLDTGAQVSMISSAFAAQLGVDTAHPVDTIEVGGVGGTVEVPLVDSGTTVVKARDGMELAWTRSVVGVIDIDAAIQGVFGMDFLDSGWLNAVLDGTGQGFVSELYLDFRDAAAGDLALALNDPAHVTRRPPHADRSAVVVRLPGVLRHASARLGPGTRR